MATYIENPIISDNFRKSVLESVGYPVVDEETIYDFYPQNDVDNLVIAECMEKFFNFFPIIKEIEIPVSQGVIEIDALENTLGIVHYTLVNNGGGNINLNSGNPFYTSSQVMTTTSTYNSWGTPFKYGQTQYSQYQKKFYNDSLKNLMGGNQYYCKFNEDDNKFEIKSVSNGVMHVRVGLYSNNVNDIPKNKKEKFLDYCKSLMGYKFAKVVKLMNDDLPLQIDADTLYDDSKDDLEKIEEWLSQNSTIQLMR